jgi:hypothetical protein
MGAGRLLNRKNHRKASASLKTYCRKGHEPVLFSGSSCPLCYKNMVIDWYAGIANEHYTITLKQPNRVARGAKGDIL